MYKKEETQRGITLIALIITIIVMLILVSVTISMAVNGGLFEYAGKAARETKNAINAENELAKGRIQIGGVWYDSIGDYLKNKPSSNQGETDEEVINAVGTVDNDNTITLASNLPNDTYTLKYENKNGILQNYKEICTLTVTDDSGTRVYDDLIPENCAPVEATIIGVYNSTNERVGDIALGHLGTTLGNKMYSFAAISDVHIGYDNAPNDLHVALDYLNDNQKVSFITVCGDLTADCSDENLDMYKDIVDLHSNIPVYAITGNHDTEQYRGSNITESIHEYTGKPMYYSITQGNDVFIFLGTYNGYDAGRIFTREQLQWFYETLEANKDKRCFVFEHVRPDETSGNPGDLQSVDMWDGTEAIIFESLLEHYPNVTVFHGHSHTAFDLQSISDIANYDNFLGCHSVHIPALFGTRELNAGSYYEDMYASEGYVVDVYENNIVIRGLDFGLEEFLPIATYCLDTRIKNVEANTYVDETITINCPTVIPTWTFGTTIDGSTGAISTNADYSSTDLINIEQGNDYYAHQYYGCIYAGHAYYYDSNGAYISREQIWYSDDLRYLGPVKLNIPNGAKSFRIRQWTGNEQSELTKDVFITYTESTSGGSTYTNVLDTVGYIENKRLSGSTGEEKDSEGTYVTGYIPVKQGDVIYLKNVTMPIDGANPNNFYAVYLEDKTYNRGYPLLSTYDYVTADTDGNIVRIFIDYSDAKYVRIGAQNIDENSIITVNEPIG